MLAAFLIVVINSIFLMAYLNFVIGEKGGVGKSMFCRTYIQHQLDKATPITVFELDRSNPDVKRVYSSEISVRLAVFSENPALEDASAGPFNAAEHQNVICNTPAQFSIPFKAFVEKNDIVELSREIGVQIILWFVSNCSVDSLNLFQKSLSEFGHVFPHIFVKNEGMTDDWSPFDEDERIQQLVADYRVETMILPRFVGNRDRNKIDELSMSFGEARHYEGFGPISRQRVKSYLRKCYAELDRVFASPIFKGGVNHD